MTPIANFFWPATHPVFAGHFPDHPIVPAALLLAVVEQHATRWLKQQEASVLVTGVTMVKFKRPVGPDQTCTLLCDAPGADALRFRIEVDTALCVTGALRLRQSDG